MSNKCVCKIQCMEKYEPKTNLRTFTKRQLQFARISENNMDSTRDESLKCYVINVLEEAWIDN